MGVNFNLIFNIKFMVELYPKQEREINTGTKTGAIEGTGTITVEAEGNSEQETEQLKQKLERLE